MAKARKGASKTARKPAASSTKQKPLATGDVDTLPQNAFRADMGEGLPPQKDTLNPNRAK